MIVQRKTKYQISFTMADAFKKGGKPMKLKEVARKLERLLNRPLFLVVK